MAIGTHQSVDSVESIRIQSQAENTQTENKPKQIHATTTWQPRFQQGQFSHNLAEWVSRFDLGPPELYESQPDALDRGSVPSHMERQCLHFEVHASATGRAVGNAYLFRCVPTKNMHSFPSVVLTQLTLR